MLQNLEVKPRAMQTALKLPLVVKAGTIGRVELRIPWAKLNSEPTQLILDVRRASQNKSSQLLALRPLTVLPPPRPATQDLFIICGPQSETAWDAEAAEAEIKAKLECLAAREKQQIVVRDEDAERQNASFSSKLTQAVLDRLQVRVSNVTVRYEDRSHGAVPYSISLQLRSLEVQNGTAPQQSSPDQPGSSAAAAPAAPAALAALPPPPGQVAASANRPRAASEPPPEGAEASGSGSGSSQPQARKVLHKRAQVSGLRKWVSAGFRPDLCNIIRCACEGLVSFHLASKLIVGVLLLFNVRLLD